MRSPHQIAYQGEPARLDKVLVSELESVQECSRSQVERWIEQGLVTVNARVIKKSSWKVSAGDIIELQALIDTPSALSPFQFKLDILFEDSELLVINKPAGLSVHPGAGNRDQTLANAVVHHVGQSQLAVGQSDRPGIVHRLDKDTTGALVIAKSTATHAALARQFADRTIERAYRALVFTTPRARRPVQVSDEGEISAPIGRHPTKRTLMAIVEHGKPAVTHWRLVERFSHATLLECRLKTGRTHQIRVHLHSLGCPVIGDKTYGDFTNLPPKLRDAADKFGRQALHAYTLGFEHPVSKKRLLFTAPVPDDFEALVGRFRGSV
jgi:23S rRNA pseudouridine1911/1915/1917 synthase